MEKNTYYVITVSNDAETKFYATSCTVSNNTNILAVIKHVMKQYKNIKTMNACDTKKKSMEIAEHWNECYKKNGTLLF